MSIPTFDLGASAYAEMIKNGFHPDFPAGSDAQVAAIRAAADARVESNEPLDAKVRDLRELYWSSIDNDTSRDLDQAEWAEKLMAGGADSGSKDGGIRVRVAVANVAAAVGIGSPIDRHASDQTKTVYTATRNFPMLPNQLSTDLTSLNQNEDRAAIVTEYIVDAQGALSGHNIYRAMVHNRAQLAYSRVGTLARGQKSPRRKDRGVGGVAGATAAAERGGAGDAGASSGQWRTGVSPDRSGPAGDRWPDQSDL